MGLRSVQSLSACTRVHFTLVVTVGGSYEQYQNMRANGYCSVVMYIDSRVGGSHKWGQKIVSKASHSVAGLFSRFDIAIRSSHLVP